MQDNTLNLLNKYDKAIPRYTSYPTVPYWEPETITTQTWMDAVVRAFEAEKGAMSLYIHLPYCENLCTFCACNKRITRNHGVEDRYIDAILKEWAMYQALFKFTPVLQEIHLGGGTPTFFSPKNLKRLIEGVTNDLIIPDGHEFSVEVHPNYTQEEHL